MGKILIFFIRLYQLALRPFFGHCCRFYPSCSAYFIEAVQEWGMVKGTFLGMRRLCRCHPFHPGGFDPVPGKIPLSDGQKPPWFLKP
jgi:putative membrane protein insertion efficiency factor